MDNQKISKFQEMIKEELTKVEAELKTVGRRNPDNPGDWEAVPEKMDILASDDNEVADSIEAYEENTGILKQLEIRYNELKDALLQIEKGNYGKCETCGEQIEEDRLEANPGARTCKLHMNASSY
jgi:RNA polymerase-binding transcription factor DksA